MSLFNGKVTVHSYLNINSKARTPRVYFDTIYIFNGTDRSQIFTRIEGIKGSYKMTAMDILLRPAGESSTLNSNKGSLILDNPVDIGGIVELKKI